MKCLLTYKLSLSLFSPEITFENTNFSIISRETKTEIMCLSLSMSLRIFVNPGPDIDTTTSTSDDNPFAGPRTQPTGKVLVKMPTDEWLCKKMENLT